MRRKGSTLVSVMTSSENIKISVIVPIYNVEPYLEEALDSVLCQTLHEIEIICIDDGSPDNSLDILKRYEQKDNRIVIISRQNKGVAYSRNEGILKAVGKYIAFLDPDDFYPAPDILELLYTKAEEHQVLICGGEMALYSHTDATLSQNFDPEFKKYTFEKEGIIKYSDYQFDYGYTRFLYNRRMILNHTIFFPLYTTCEDPCFFIHAMVQAKEFYAIKRITYAYRQQHKPTVMTTQKMTNVISGIKTEWTLATSYHLNLLKIFIYWHAKSCFRWYHTCMSHETCQIISKMEPEVRILLSDAPKLAAELVPARKELLCWTGKSNVFSNDSHEDINRSLTELLLQHYCANSNIRCTTNRHIASVLCCGELLDKRQFKECIILLGSGINDTSKIAIQPHCFAYAVRGKISKEKLGIKDDIALGDPALLLPLILSHPRQIEEKAPIGIVPRIDSLNHSSLTSYRHNDAYRIISLKQPIHRIAQEIAGCSAIVASDLSALIIADAYGIPNAFLKVDSKDSNLKNTCFEDYCSAIGRSVKDTPIVKIEHISTCKTFPNSYQINISNVQAKLDEALKKFAADIPFWNIYNGFIHRRDLSTKGIIKALYRKFATLMHRI